MHALRIGSLVALLFVFAGCQPTAVAPLVQGLAKADPKIEVKDPKIEVKVQADKQGALTGIELNGKSLGRDPQALLQGVVPLVAAANRAGKKPKASILVGTEVRNADFQRVLAALTNDVVDGKFRYTLVEEWELRVEGSPLVLTAASGKLTSDAWSEDTRFDFDETIKIEEDIREVPVVTPPKPRDKSKPKK